MKKLLIILAFLPLITWGQYQTSNLDFLFNGSIAVNGSDTLLVDSITGTFDTDYVLSNVDFDITLDYLPRKTGAKLNGYPLRCIFSNINYADTMFAQDSGQHILRIAHYSTSTSDDNDFFEVPTKGIGRDVGVGKTYSTIDAAYAAASNGDTIYVFDGDYTVATVSTYFWIQKELYIKGVGNAHTKGTSGARTVLFVGAGTKILDGLTISGENSTESVLQTFSGSSDNYVRNCYIENATITGINDPINIWEGTDININACTFIGSGTDYLLRSDGIVQTFTNCHFGGHFGVNLYSEASDTTISFINCDFDLLSGDILSTVVFEIGNYDFIGNSFTIRNATTSIIEKDQGGSGLDFTIKNNTITTSIVSDTLINLENIGYDSLLIRNNTILSNHVSSIAPIIALKDLNCNVYFDSNFIDTRNTTSQTHIMMTTDAQTFGDVYINYNELHSRSVGGYNIRIGTELTTSGDYMIDGGEIVGNLIRGALYFNPATEGMTIHNIFVGFNKNWNISYNYVDGGALSYIVKSSSGVNTLGGFFYNIAKNPYVYGYYSKGHESVKFYNNVSYNELDNLVKHFYLSENEGADGANNCDFKNNIAYDSRNDAENLGLRINSGVTGTLSDYNCYYMAGGNFGENGTTNRTLSEWQSANSLDLNSFDTDPNFKSSTELWLITPSNAIGNGVNLGVTYNQGLDISSVWTDNIILKAQFDNWTMGVYPIKKPALIRSGSRLIVIGNKSIFY